MQQLLGDSACPQPDNSLLRKLFFQQLPATFAVSYGDTVSLDTLADMADKMLEVAPSTVSSLTYAAVPPTPPPPPPTTSAEVAQLWSEVSELRQLISSLQLSPGRPSCSHSQPRPHCCASSPGPSSSLCWYYWRFGDKANKCTSPCSPGRETSRPSAVSDQRYGPTT